MALVLIKAVFRVDPWNKMVTLLIVITDLNRFLWRVPMGYKQLPKHVRIDRWMDCFNAVTVN